MTAVRLPLVLLLLAVAAPATPAQQDGSSASSDRSSPDSAPSDSTSPPSGASGNLAEPAGTFYTLDALNTGLPDAGTPANLRTPQAALEHFVLASRAGRFDDAARALNLSLVPEDEQAARGPDLAAKLHYVLDKQLGFDWEGLPDRPDGMAEGSARPDDPLAGEARRSILLGTIPVEDRDAAIRLQRVRAGAAAPVWVFSAQTVDNVEALYRQHRPGPIERLAPGWSRAEPVGNTPVWAWLVLLAMMVAAALFALAVRRFARGRFDDSDEGWARAIGGRVATPVAVAAAAILLYALASSVLSLPGPVTVFLLVLVIVSVIWVAMRVTGALAEHVAADQVDDIEELSGDDGTREQHRLTYLSVGRRVLLFVLFLLGAGLVIAQFRSLQALGISLVASAGVATVLLGIAAQPVLGNIVASVQVALTKPVRIGDSVFYEGNWGYVEDITYTYVVIRTWDERRLIVPLRWFVTHPFENWTMRSAHVVKPIVLHLDYRVDVQRIRERFEELLRGSEEWDGEKEPTVQVLSVGEETVEVRALCSARNPSAAWDLHCRLREELLAFVREMDGGRYLPHRRLLVDGRLADEDDDGSRSRAAGDGAGAGARAERR